jgi:hypothetical protein
MTYNRNNNIVLSTIFECICDQIEDGVKMSPKDLMAKLMEIFKKHGAAMTEFNTSDEEKSALLGFIETYCANHSYLGS